MGVRRYQARDMREAMRQVLEQQGANAVILSSRRLSDGMLEVVAEVESSTQSALQPRRAGELGRVRGGVDPELMAVRRELSDLRTLLLRQQTLGEREAWAARHPLAARLLERLRHCGFDEELARNLIGTVQEDGNLDAAWSRLCARLSAALALARPQVLEQGGMLALVGTSGVGKTTTLSRLALRQIRRMGPESVTLVTLDRQRFGAYRQLQAFGQMASLPVMLLDHERDLVTLSSRSGNGKLVLIDTEGQAARDVTEQRMFAQVRRQVALETWLVVAATHQAAVLRQVLRAFQGCQPSALVLTKLDEAERFGEVLSVLLEQPLGLTFYSDGRRIEEDFHAADAGALTRLAVRGAGEREVVSDGSPSRPLAKASGQDTIEVSASPRMQLSPLEVMSSRADAADIQPLQAIATNRQPLREQASASTVAHQADGLLLESIMPFRKTLHAVQ